MERARRSGWIWFAPLLWLAVFVAMTVGCAAVPVVEVPVTDLALAYADARSEVAIIVVLLSQACADKKLALASCERLSKAYEKALVLDERVRLAIANPKRPPDPAVIREYVNSAMGFLTQAAAAGLLKLPVP